MSAEADYTIRAQIVASDASGPGARSAEAGIDRVFAKAGRLSGALSNMFALAGGAYGLGRFTQGFIGINSQIQDATNGLATLYTAMTGTDIGRSFRVAQQDVDRLRQQAAEGVGELQDYLFGYQRILGPGLGAGATTDDLMRLNQLAISAAGAMGRELQLGPMDVVQALTAGATDRTTPIVTAALAALGKTNEEFNKLSVPERMEMLADAFGTFGPGVELMGRSWNAQLSTFSDGLKNIVRTVTAPLFETWTERLRDANDWIKKNQEQIETIATTWGARLVRMWDTLIDRAGTYAAIVGAAYLAPSAGGMVAGVGGAATAGQGLAGRIGAGLRDPLGMAGMMGASGATPGIISMLGGAWAAFSRLAAPVALVTTLVLAVRGAFRDFGEVGAYALSAWGRLVGALGALGLGFDTLTAKGSALNILGAALVGTFGGVIDVLGIGLRGIASLAVGLGLVFQVIGDGLTALWYLSTGNLAAASQIDVMGRLNAANAALGQVWTFGDTTQAPVTQPEGTEGLNVKGNGNTIINGPVTLSVKAEINDDPNRTLIAVGRAFDQIRTAAVQGRRIPGLAGA